MSDYRRERSPSGVYFFGDIIVRIPELPVRGYYDSSFYRAYRTSSVRAPANWRV